MVVPNNALSGRDLEMTAEVSLVGIGVAVHA
jgi:hypothetical protein